MQSLRFAFSPGGRVAPRAFAIAIVAVYLASFLSQLSDRFARRGHSPRDFDLRMTRQELGSYIGLKVETVSRLFSCFRRNGWIAVSGRHVRILDMASVARLAGRAATGGPRS